MPETIDPPLDSEDQIHRVGKFTAHAIDQAQDAFRLDAQNLFGLLMTMMRLLIWTAPRRSGGRSAFSIWIR